MSNYLTIGQVAQIKNINVKSLRYYDKIGVLKPAYTDPYTGYRYYTPQQLLYVDLVKFLIDLDIPLKNWPDYYFPDGSFNLKKLLADGKVISEQKIINLRRGLQRVEMATIDIDYAQQYADFDRSYTRYIPERHYLYQPIKHEHNAEEFQKVMQKLINQCHELGVAHNFPAGIIRDYDNSNKVFSIFIKVYEPIPDCPNYRFIPSGYYHCIRTVPMEIYHLEELYPKELAMSKTEPIIEEDYILQLINVEKPMVELQFPIDMNHH